MVRTRDVVLVIVCIGFLLVVGASQLGQLASQQTATVFAVTETAPVETVGVETVIREDNRAEQVALWRERLQGFIAPAPVVVELPEEDPSLNTDVGGVQLCATGYGEYSNPLPRLYNFEAEGVRVFTSVEQPELVDGTNTFVVLPIRMSPGGGAHCLPTDVVGVAVNGSLIRNNQQSTYGIFEAETLVGYALDGFPIYGRIDSSLLDACGGRVTPAGYQYHIATERGNVIQCFSAPPVALP